MSPTLTERSPRAALPETVTRTPPVWRGATVLRQRWTELAFFHWRYEPHVVQRLLPDGIAVDTFDRDAWVGLIPFEMRDVRVGPTPAVPYLGSFIEVNVRTYVIDRHGRRGVWFFSLDVPRSPIVAVARTAFALPYCWASARHDVDGEHHRYRIQRRRPHRATPTADIAFRVGDALVPHETDELDDFLTARWALMTERGRRLEYGRVDHPPWPLHHVHDVRIDEQLIEAAGLPRPVGVPHARYSPGTSVRVGWLERIGAEP